MLERIESGETTSCRIRKEAETVSFYKVQTTIATIAGTLEGRWLANNPVLLGAALELQTTLQSMDRIEPGRYDGFVYLLRDTDSGRVACIRVSAFTSPDGVDPDSLSDRELARLKPRSWPVSVRWLGEVEHSGNDPFGALGQFPQETKVGHPRDWSMENRRGNILWIECGLSDAEKVLRGQRDPVQLVNTHQAALQGDFLFAMAYPLKSRAFFDQAGIFFRYLWP